MNFIRSVWRALGSKFATALMAGVCLGWASDLAVDGMYWSATAELVIGLCLAWLYTLPRKEVQ